MSEQLEDWNISIKGSNKNRKNLILASRHCIQLCDQAVKTNTQPRLNSLSSHFITSIPADFSAQQRWEAEKNIDSSIVTKQIFKLNFHNFVANLELEHLFSESISYVWYLIFCWYPMFLKPWFRNETLSYGNIGNIGISAITNIGISAKMSYRHTLTFFYIGQGDGGSRGPPFEGGGPLCHPLMTCLPVQFKNSGGPRH